MNSAQDFATERVISHNETITWCHDIMEGMEYAVHRPHVGILQSRNFYLHQAMNYRPHQQEV